MLRPVSAAIKMEVSRSPEVNTMSSTGWPRTVRVTDQTSSRRGFGRTVRDNLLERHPVRGT